MNQLKRWIYRGSLSAGILLAEYEILQRFGGSFVVFAAVCALATIAGTLYLAPIGHERADGFHLRPRKEPSAFLSAIRPSQRQMRRGWT
jgi:hypothetical protein